MSKFTCPYCGWISDEYSYSGSGKLYWFKHLAATPECKCRWNFDLEIFRLIRTKD